MNTQQNQTMSSSFITILLIILNPVVVVTQTATPLLFAPVQKDPNTLLYIITLHLKTPPQPTKLHLDLGASFTWLDCSNSNSSNNNTNPSSSTYKRISCSSPLCISFHPFACANHSCSLYPENPITRQATLSSAFTDSLSLPTAPSGHFSLLPRYVLSCSTAFLLHGLATDVTGLAALGRSNHSLPAQVSNALSLPRYFALCLSSLTSESGVVLFGLSGSLSKSLAFSYAKLILNPVASTVISYHQQPSDEYYIGLTSIKVNGKLVELNSSQLSIDENGYGGTKLSTDTPYTILESSIYKAFVELFINESAGLNLTGTSAIKPFDVCYQASDVINTRVGPGVPTVDLVMEGDGVFWRIFGWNSMVRIAKDGVDVWCLGFVDGGINVRTSIVIGGHQMEDNFLIFDLDSNRFGFSSSLLLKGTTCSNFNFSQ